MRREVSVNFARRPAVSRPAGTPGATERGFVDKNETLKFDRRLHKRRGWVQPSELQKMLERLPDAADHAEWVDAPGSPAPEPKQEGAE